MSAAEPDIQEVAERLAALRHAIDAIRDAGDRGLVRDAIRDALDRDADPSLDGAIVANSFAVLSRLHRGAEFEVLLLRQRDLGTLHALKTVRPERASDPLLRRILIDEARWQDQVRHPACLALRALLRLGDGRPALLTDHLAAPTLAVELRARPLDAAACVTLGLRLLEALGAVQTAGLVHGDVSPGNVFLPDDAPEAAVLFDFGLARPIASPLLSPDLRRALTPGFAAPERDAPGARAETASDIFSLGRLLAASCAPAERSALAPALDLFLRADPRERPASAPEAAEALRRCGPNATTQTKKTIPTATNQFRAL